MSLSFLATQRANPWLWAGLTWAVAALFILAVFHIDAAHLVSIWANDSNFEHCFLILPVIAWLVWLRADALSDLSPRPWPAAILFMVPGGLIWLLGYGVEIALLRHAGLVFLLQASVPIIFGPAVTRQLAFPFFYMLLLIPAGDQLTPLFQKWTTDFCVFLLTAFHVPHTVSGIFIYLPGASFEISTDCAGTRFFIAMAAFSTLMANVFFQSWRRRLIFVASAMAFSVLSNMLRAFGTIYLGYYVDPAFARGVDHLIYGWVFFFISGLIVFFAARPFFEDMPPAAPSVSSGAGASPLAGGFRLVQVAWGLGSVFLAIGAVFGLKFWLESRPVTIKSAYVTLATPAGWSPTTPPTSWKPHYQGASWENMWSFTDDKGPAVELYVALFSHESERGKLLGFGQGAYVTGASTDGWIWSATQPSVAGGRAMQIEHLGAVRDVVQWYWVNGRVATTPVAVQWEKFKARIMGHPPLVGTVILSARREKPALSAMPQIERFISQTQMPDRIFAQLRDEGTAN